MDNLSRHGGHSGLAFHAVSLTFARRMASAVIRRALGTLATAP